MTDGRGRGGRGVSTGTFAPRAPPIPVPAEEFDFVKSNQQFDKEAIVKVHSRHSHDAAMVQNPVRKAGPSFVLSPTY